MGYRFIIFSKIGPEVKATLMQIIVIICSKHYQAANHEKDSL